MYFIARGTCQVLQKRSHIVSVAKKEEDQEQERRINTLIESEHFGEISLLYECKRTCSVISSNYCTLAAMSRQNFMEIHKQFDTIVAKFKQQILFYEDEVKIFIEREMNKIQYFNFLSQATKQDLIFGMERKTYDKDSFIC